MKKERNFSNINIFNAIIVIATITIFIMLFSSSSKFNKEIIGGKNIPAKAGLVTSADVIIRDGEAPFDSNNNPGNDSNDHNNIVRSNDKLVYEIKPYVNLTSSSPANIIIKGTLPKKNLIYWHKEEIDKFAKGYIKYSQDSNNYYFTYERNYNELTAEKGSSTISLYFDVLVSGAKNNELIEPTFEIYMSGNSEEQKKILKPNAVKVSSVNRTKIELGQGGQKQEKVTYNGKVGRMNSISVYVKMENDKNKKGLIGLEYPQEDILSDLEFKTFLNPKNGGIAGRKKEFTDDFRPEVMQYGLNTLGEYEFKMKENENYPYYYIADTGLPDTRMLYRIYDGLLTFVNKDNYITGGNIQVNNTAKGSATARFFNYKLNEKNIFPVGGIWSSKRDYPETDGYITAANIVVFCPFPDEEYIQGFLKEKGSSISPNNLDYTVDLEVKLKNKRIKENNQEIPVYGESNKTYICNKKEDPKDESVLRIFENNTDNKDALPASEGNSRFNGLFRVVDKFKARNSVTKFRTQDEEYKTYGTALFLKFDGNLIEPTGYVSNKFRINKIYYLTKKDGKNWKSETEMKNARYDAFNYYETVEEAKKHGTVVGVVGQGVKRGEKETQSGNVMYQYYAEFKTKENVKPGTVGLFSNMAYNYFKRNENQDGGNFLDGTFKPPSEKEGYLVLEEYPNREKTKYDSEGNNTNNGNPTSYLILNAMPEIKIETNRNVYNLINRESVVNLSIVPSIKTSVRASKTEKKKVRIEITIPKGLEFDKETVKIGGESAKPISVTKVGDNTKIIFEYETTYDEKDYASKVITFNAKIDRSIRNNTYLKMDALTKIIGEAPSYITERQATKSINVQNSLAEVAYQNIKRRVIEYGENFNFEIAMLNNSRNSHQEVTLFNILPYNTGDATNSESFFDGTYKISNLKSSRNAYIYYTTDEKIRNYNAKNYNEAGVTWHRYTGGSIENVKAIYSKSSISAYSDHKITFDILPVGQKVTNTYINDFSTHIKGQGGILQVKEKVAIAKRNIHGKIWEDENIDGKITEGEKNLKDITLSLRQEDGQKVTRLDGTVVEDVVTNEKGEYIFEDVPPIKNLKVVMHKNDNMQVTKKGLDNVANNEFEITNISPMPAIDMNKDDTTLNYIQNLTKYDIGIIYKKDVQVKKIWKYGKERPEIEVALYRNIEDGKKEEVKRQKITTEANSNESTYTFSNLEVIDENDNIYTYSADEINVPENYTKEVSKDGLTITNTYSIPKKDIQIKKLWKNGKVRPDVEVALYRNILGGKKEEVEKATVKTDIGSDEAKHIFSNVDRTDIAGNEYTYSIDEANVPTNYNKKIVDNSTILNEYVSPKKDVKITKKWIGGSSRPDINVILYRHIKGDEKHKEKVQEQIVKTKEGTNESIYTFTNLDKTDKNANEYIYTIDEANVPVNYIKDIDNENYIIKNTYVSPKREFDVTKKWIGGNKREDIQVQLYRNGKKHLEPITLKTEVGSNEAKYTFRNLDKTDKNANDYIYTADEVTTPSYFVKSLNIEDSNNNIITNTYVSPKVDIAATKKWVGGENARPDTITFALYRNIEGGKKEKVTEEKIEVTEGNQFTHIFTKQDKTDKNGKIYTYSVEEINVPANYSKEETGLVVINTYNSPKIDVPVSMIYVNGKLKRKDVKIELLRNGKKIGEVEFKVEKENNEENKQEGKEQKDETKNTKDKYEHVFKDLDKTDKSGKDYNYQIRQVTDVKDFVKKEQGLSVVNEYVIPKIDISFAKKWIDSFGEKEKPEIEVGLYRDGKKHLDIATLKDGNTSYTWEKQDRTDKDGKEHSYDIKEELVPKYYNEKIVLKNESEDKKEFEITNTFTMPKVNTKGNVVWKNGPDSKPDIEIELLANDKKIDNVILGDGKTTFEFKNLDIFDKHRKEIKYSVKQNMLTKKYIKENNIKYDLRYDSNIVSKEVLDIEKDREFEITNTYIIPKTEMKAKKTWINAEGNKPKISLTLYKDGKRFKEQVLESGKSECIFEDLDRTDEKGNEYEYSIDEEKVPEGYIKKKSKEGNTIVNIRDKKDEELPYAGTKGNNPLKISLIILVVLLIKIRRDKKRMHNIGI